MPCRFCNVSYTIQRVEGQCGAARLSASHEIIYVVCLGGTHLRVVRIVVRVSGGVRGAIRRAVVRLVAPVAGCRNLLRHLSPIACVRHVKELGPRDACGRKQQPFQWDARAPAGVLRAVTSLKFFFSTRNHVVNPE